MGDVIDKPPTGYRDFAKVFAAAAYAEDVEDYKLAHSGAEIPGRAGKYFSTFVFDPLTGSYKTKAEKQAEETARSLRWLMANDPEFAQAMTSAKQVFVDVLDKAATIIDQLSGVQTRLLDDRADLRSKAPTLEDGRRVYRDAQGRVRDEDGNIIPSALAAHIEWQGHEPNYEEYRALQDQLDSVKAAIDQARGIETEAGRLQGDLTNPDTPPQSAEEVREIEDQGRDLQRHLEEIENLALGNLTLEQSVSDKEVASQTASATINMPQILK